MFVKYSLILLITFTTLLSNIIPFVKSFPDKSYPIKTNNGVQRVVNAVQVDSVSQRVTRQVTPAERAPHPDTCKCMDYWECVGKEGQIYSYCGLRGADVCCFLTKKNPIEQLIENFETANNGLSRSTSNPPSTETVASSTGNENLSTLPNDSIETTPTLMPFTTTSSPQLSITDLPDVDYFYSLENGNGGIRVATRAPAAAVNIKNGNDKVYPCGTQSITWKLNSKAEFREWPWHVAVLEVSQDVYICGGVLIANDKVLTASHCVDSYTRRDSPKLKVRAGEYDVATVSEEDPYFEIVVEKIIVHPSFNNATLANDIAILKLQTPLNYSSSIIPICFPTRKSDSALVSQHDRSNVDSCVVTGWGRSSENSSFSVLLKEIVVPLKDRSECQQQLRTTFGTSYDLPEASICAGEIGHDACDGDGGGGLACFNAEAKQWQLVGIVSFGIGCGRLDIPGVYTSVLPYVQWIDAFNYL